MVAQEMCLKIMGQDGAVFWTRLTNRRTQNIPILTHSLPVSDGSMTQFVPTCLPPNVGDLLMRRCAVSMLDSLFGRVGRFRTFHSRASGEESIASI